MEEQQPDVNNPEESSTSESINTEAEVQETQPDASQEAQAETEVQDTQTLPAPQPVDQEVDELGVPYKNRYMESQRKLDKVLEQQNALLERANQPQGQKEEKYSITELENFIDQTEDPGHKSWARGEIRRLNREENSKVVKEAITGWKQEQQAEVSKAQSLQTVMARYPDAFAKDRNGNPVGWDHNSPLAQSIGQYMRDPEIANNPRGLLVAAALAYSDIGPGQVHKQTKEAVMAKAQVKNLQKKSLTEGGGVNSPPTPQKTPLSAAKERLAQSGSVKDGAAAFKEILKSSGRIKEG